MKKSFIIFIFPTNEIYLSLIVKTDKNRLLILVLLSVAFLGYSFDLYVSPPKEKDGELINNSLAAEGKLLWQKKNCTSCHQIYGLGGHLGPDLTNIASKRSREHIEVFLKHGTNVMPDFNLSQQEIDAFQAFFIALDQSGQSDPRTFKLHLDGTVSQ